MKKMPLDFHPLIQFFCKVKKSHWKVTFKLLVRKKSWVTVPMEHWIFWLNFHTGVSNLITGKLEKEMTMINVNDVKKVLQKKFLTCFSLFWDLMMQPLIKFMVITFGKVQDFTTSLDQTKVIWLQNLPILVWCDDQSNIPNMAGMKPWLLGSQESKLFM